MDVLEAIRRRRAINFFDPAKEVSDETIRELLELGTLAPSSFNLQPWKVIVVKSQDKKRALRRCASNQKKVEDASAVLIFIADPEAVEKNLDKVLDKNIELGYMKPEGRQATVDVVHGLYGPKDSIKRKIFAAKNTAFFAMTVMLAAQGLGLETHPMDGFDEEAIKKEFGIPEDKIIPCIVAIGYLQPGVTLLPRYRFPVDEIAKFV